MFSYVNFVIDPMGNSCESRSVYTDFTKAFNKVSSSILLHGLSIYEVSGPLLQLFFSLAINPYLQAKW